MTIQFSYDRKQVIQALRYHFFTRPEIRVLVIVINIFTIVSAVLLYLKKIQPVSFLIFSLLWLLLMLVIWWVLPNSIYKRNHTFADRFSMTFNEQDVVLANDQGRKSWSWSAFSQFVETPYFFHLYFDNRSFFLVPKDAFENITDQQELRALLKTKVSPKVFAKGK
jgi:hypothetical protein